MSQSETWDRLREAADWRDGGPPQQTMAERIIDAAHGGVRPEPSPPPEMPEPEAKWLRRTSSKTAKNVAWRASEGPAARSRNPRDALAV